MSDIGHSTTKTSFEECLELAHRAAEAADAGEYNVRCMAGEPVFYYPHTHGLMPGHIYSELGVEEFRISQSCEYHFDDWTKEPDDEDIPEDSLPVF